MTTTKKQAGRPPIDGLTPAQIRTLTAIKTFIRSHKVPPTMQELAFAMNVNAASAYEHVIELARKGFLKREPHKARCIKICRKAALYLA